MVGVAVLIYTYNEMKIIQDMYNSDKFFCKDKLRIIQRFLKISVLNDFCPTKMFWCEIFPT